MDAFMGGVAQWQSIVKFAKRESFTAITFHTQTANPEQSGLRTFRESEFLKTETPSGSMYAQDAFVPDALSVTFKQLQKY